MSYLEDFLDKISFLPNDINRYLRLMREIDEKHSGNANIYHFNKIPIAKFQEMENKQAAYINILKMSKDRKNESKKKENKQLYDDIQNLHEECSGLALEKIEISNQIQEQVQNY